jgi:hemerythrin-like metal-binding protein
MNTLNSGRRGETMSLTESRDDAHQAIDAIDGDHRELTRRLVEVRTAVTHGDPEEIGAALERLRVYSLAHFGLEESMMRASQYPNTTEHVGMHLRMVEALNHLIERRSREGGALSQERLESIEMLHIKHMRGDDARFGDWLNKSPK